MNVPGHAAAAARLLRQDLNAPDVAVGDRVRGLATIELAMKVRARRRRWLGVSVVAAAAASLVAIGLAHQYASGREEPRVAIQVAPLGNGATLSDLDHAQQRLNAPAQIKAGQLLETPPGGGASLRLSTGTNLTLAGETVLRVQSQSSVERFALLRGELSARVAKLSSGERFIVQTPDTEVEVRGTSFMVAVLDRGDACSSTSRTRLRVDEGIVEVRSTSGVARVTAGQYWPARCGEQRPEPLPPTAEPRPAQQREKGVASPNPRGSTSDRASALAHQNNLFAEGVALRRKGDAIAALRTYQQLMREYPSSPLAENAAVERLRLLSQGQSTKAREEARAYLRRYPRGFAVEEAKRLADQP